MTGKIGIVADNYKIEKFEEKLKAENLHFTKTPFAKGLTTIKVFTTNKELVAKICKDVEFFFQQRKEKLN